MREFVVELRTGADLEYHGRIVDRESGEPIAGAQVQTLNQALSAGSIEQAVTGDDGSFRLLLPAWRVVNTAVTAQGYGRIVFQPGPGVWVGDQFL